MATAKTQTYRRKVTREDAQLGSCSCYGPPHQLYHLVAHGLVVVAGRVVTLEKLDEGRYSLSGG